MESNVDSFFEHQLQDEDEIDSSKEVEESIWSKYDNFLFSDVTA